MSSNGNLLDDEPEIDGMHPAPYTTTNWRQWWKEAHQVPVQDSSQAQDQLSNATTRRAGNLAMGAGSIGLSAASSATGHSSVMTGIALATGAAVSATGVGLLVASGTLAAGASIQAGRSYFKTKAHLKGLLEIYEGRDQYANCWSIVGRIMHKNAANERHHDLIANQVLPYIISQKQAKKIKKGIGMVPAVGSGGVSAYSIYRNLKKRWDGTLGAKRNMEARWLAYHHMNSDCPLTAMIFDELLGDGSRANFDKTEYDVLAEVLASKMKSV